MKETKLPKSKSFIAVLIISMLITIGFAVVYVTKEIPMYGEVKVVGSIRVWLNPELTEELLTWDFGKYDVSGFVNEDKDLTIYIENIGNIETYVRWWATGFDGWQESPARYYKLTIRTDDNPSNNAWSLCFFNNTLTEIYSTDSVTPSIIEIPYGEVYQATIRLSCIKHALPEDNISFNFYIEASDS